MASLVTQFFRITGVGVGTPTCMEDLIPYLLTVFIALFLVSAVFGILGWMIRLLFGAWLK